MATRPVRCVPDRPKSAPRRPKRRSRAQWESRVKCELLHTGRPPSSDILALCRIEPYGESRGRCAMLYKTPIRMVVLGLVCASGASANATDLCVRIGGGGAAAVLESPPFQKLGMTFPTGEENTCAPVSGFEDTGFIQPFEGSAGGRITGSGCLDPNGRSFSYHYVYHNAVPFADIEYYFETGVCHFDVSRGPPTKDKPAEGRCRGQVLRDAVAGHEHKGFLLPAWLWNCDLTVPFFGPLGP
jgi:hypothetical protein